ncbi:MAG TPA: hypothetical protein VMB04_21615 [Mycobacterium sp.]|nr:hypothetical protein [Mycobacterium sp.]
MHRPGAPLRADCGMLAGPGPRRARAPVRTSFTADEIDTIYHDLWAAGYVLHCTDIEDGEVVVPTVDRLREIGDVLHDIYDGLLKADEADARPRR